MRGGMLVSLPMRSFEPRPRVMSETPNTVSLIFPHCSEWHHSEFNQTSSKQDCLVLCSCWQPSECHPTGSYLWFPEELETYLATQLGPTQTSTLSSHLPIASLSLLLFHRSGIENWMSSFELSKSQHLRSCKTMLLWKLFHRKKTGKIYKNINRSWGHRVHKWSRILVPEYELIVIITMIIIMSVGWRYSLVVEHSLTHMRPWIQPPVLPKEI